MSIFDKQKTAVDTIPEFLQLVKDWRELWEEEYPGVDSERYAELADKQFGQDAFQLVIAGEDLEVIIHCLLNQITELNSDLADIGSKYRKLQEAQKISFDASLTNENGAE